MDRKFARARRSLFRVGFTAAFGGMFAVPAIAAELPIPAFDVPSYKGAEQLPDIQLRWSDFNGPTSEQAMPVKAFLEYVDRASNGKIKIEVFWASALMSYGESAGGIASGLADMGSALPVYTPTDLPVANFLNSLPMLADSGYPAGQLVMTGVAAEFAATNEDMKRELAGFGLHALGASGAAGYDTLCNKPWSDLASAKGKRTRTPGQSFAFEVQDLGMVPVPMTYTEVYEAFSRGILDCVILNPGAYISSGSYDVPGPKIWVNVPLSSFIFNAFMFNKERWDALPPTAQKILTDAAVLSATLSPVASAQNYRTFGDLIRSGAVTPQLVGEDVTNQMSAFQKRTLEELRAKAPPAVSDAHAFVAQYEALFEKWNKIVREELRYPGQRENLTDASTYIDAWYPEYDFGPFAARLREELAKSNRSFAGVAHCGPTLSSKRLQT